MGIYNIHAGHGVSGGQGCGAIGILDESIEARKVKNKLIEVLKNHGDTIYDCTFEGSASQNTILNKIVEKCNQHKVDYDISIHLNSGRNDRFGDGRTGGVEVWGYNSTVKDMGLKICNEISTSLGLTSRGFKTSKTLSVLRNTKSKAILIECCFVDDADDAKKWNADKCAIAIARALTGDKNIGTTVNTYPHYRAHCQSFGWMPVQHNGGTAGTTGKGLRMEALKIDYPGVDIYAKAHIQSKGDVDFGKINSNTVIGTVGEGKRLEALYFNGDIQFRVHIQGTGWTEWVSAYGGKWLGTKGEGKRLEAIEIKRL